MSRAAQSLAPVLALTAIDRGHDRFGGCAWQSSTEQQSREGFCPWMPGFQLFRVTPVCHFSLQPQEVLFPPSTNRSWFSSDTLVWDLEKVIKQSCKCIILGRV